MTFVDLFWLKCKYSTQNFDIIIFLKFCLTFVDFFSRQTAYITGYKTRMAINQQPLKEPSFAQFVTNGNLTEDTYISGNIANYEYKKYDGFGDLPKYIPLLPQDQTFDVAKFMQVILTQFKGPKAKNITTVSFIKNTFILTIIIV